MQTKIVLEEKNPFSEKLTAIQIREGLTDQLMAERLGCSRQLYQMTRTGRVPIGGKILKGAVQAFPELKDNALGFLVGTPLGENALSRTEPHKINPFRGLHRILIEFRRHWKFYLGL